jgi:hypothetical protein
MKSHVYRTRSSFLLLFLLLAGGGGYYAFQSMRGVRYVSLSCDALLSPAIRHYVEHQIRLYSNGDYNLGALVEQLRSHRTLIRTVQVRYLPSHIAVVEIEALKPIVAINDDHVLLENAAIIPAYYYDAAKVAAIPKITVTPPLPATVTAAMMEALERAVSRNIFERYTLHIHQEHAWYLEDTTDPSFTVCCDAATIPDQVKQMTYERLKREIRQKKIARCAWIADLRFQDQIIFSKNKGGGYG